MSLKQNIHPFAHIANNAHTAYRISHSTYALMNDVIRTKSDIVQSERLNSKPIAED